MSTLFSSHYLRNRSTLDTGVSGYIGIVQHKEHSPEVWSVPPVTACIYDISSLRVNSTTTPLQSLQLTASCDNTPHSHTQQTLSERRTKQNTHPILFLAHIQQVRGADSIGFVSTVERKHTELAKCEFTSNFMAVYLQCVGEGGRRSVGPIM